MATLLMLESWVQSTGQSLPGLILEQGHRYVLLTRDPALYPDGSDGPHPVVRHADEIVTADTNDTVSTIAAARTLAARRRIDGVLTTCDYYLQTAAATAHSLGLPGPPAEVMRRATHKHLVRAALRDAAIPDPAFALADSWPVARRAAAQLGYPLVAKPVDLNSGTSVRRIEDEAGLKDVFWEITGRERNTRGLPLSRQLLIEELLRGPEVSVEAVSYGGATTIIGITAKSVLGSPAFVEAGHMFPAPLDRATAETVEALVRRALDALGFTYGLSHTEVKLTADGPRIVEINPRQGGGYIFDLVRLVTGTHPLDILIELALGQKPTIGSTPVSPATRSWPVASAAVSFVMSPRDGVLVRVEGTKRLDAAPAVRRWEITGSGTVGRPGDNNARIGHVLTIDPHGSRAADLARELITGLRLHLKGEAPIAPLGYET